MFSSFLGEPVQIALTLDIASISSISESNMVSVAPSSPPKESLTLCFMGICFLATQKQRLTALLHRECQKLETYPETQDPGRFS